MPNLLPGLITFSIWTLSIIMSLTPILTASLNSSLLYKYLMIILAFPIFVVTFTLTAATLSYPAQKKIIRGRFPRQNFHRIYFWRRIYGSCWTNIFYFKPLYFILLSMPALKKALFRLFGYRGPTQFVIYPDTWVRDLPLLHFGEGAYCSNRSTIGTNMCLQDGTILVDRVSIGEKSVVGHLTMIAPGVKLEKDVDIGVGAAIGIRCRLKQGARVGAGSSINHGTIFGERSEVGGHSYLGLRVEIGNDKKFREERISLQGPF